MLMDSLYFQRHKPEIRLVAVRVIITELATVCNSAPEKNVSHFCWAMPCIAHPKILCSVCLSIHLSHTYIVSEGLTVFSNFFTNIQVYSVLNKMALRTRHQMRFSTNISLYLGNDKAWANIVCNLTNSAISNDLERSTNLDLKSMILFNVKLQWQTERKIIGYDL